MGLQLIQSGNDPTARAMAANARQMVLNRDEKLNTASTQAASAASQYDTLAELAAAYEQALAASLEDRANLHAQVGALAARLDDIELTPGPAGPEGPAGKAGDKGDKGDTGPAGTATMAVGLRSVTALVLNASFDVTVPLSQAMPTPTYTVRAAHSAVVDLTKVELTVKSRTTTQVVITVRATGLALAAGTLLVVAS